MWFLRVQRTWAALCSSLSRAGLVAHTSVSLLFGTGIPRCYLALASLAPRIPLLRWLPHSLCETFRDRGLDPVAIYELIVVCARRCLVHLAA